MSAEDQRQQTHACEISTAAPAELSWSDRSPTAGLGTSNLSLRFRNGFLGALPTPLC